jgi:hypothetical protein
LFEVLKGGVEATEDAATAKFVAQLCQTRRHRKEIGERELNDRITKLNEAVERETVGSGSTEGGSGGPEKCPRTCGGALGGRGMISKL